MKRPHALLLTLLGLILSACSPAQPEEAPLQGARIGGPFTLIDQNGKTVHESDFAGRYRLIYFGYSYCPDVCPTDLASIGKAMTGFDKTDRTRSAKVQPIFITVDPQRDTPTVLKDYVAAFYPRLIGLTGTEAQIADVAKRYGVAYSEEEPVAGAQGYLVDHLRQAILFGPKGEPIALVPQDEGAEAITATLDKWVR